MSKREALILVGHGQLPKDLPDRLRAEYFGLRAKRNRTEEEERRYAELEKAISAWPRNEENDPYWATLNSLATVVKERLGLNEVKVAFNEFCSPSLEEALQELCERGYERVLVVPTMFLRGGVHSEVEIPEIVEEFRDKYKGTEIIYVWPFDSEEIVELIVRHVKRIE